MWEIESGWILAAIGALWGALGAVTWAFAQWMMKRLEKCESKHAEAHDAAAKLGNELAEMRGKVAVLETISGPALATTVAAAVVQAIKADRE